MNGSFDFMHQKNQITLKNYKLHQFLSTLSKKKLMI